MGKRSALWHIKTVAVHSSKHHSEHVLSGKEKTYGPWGQWSYCRIPNFNIVQLRFAMKISTGDSNLLFQWSGDWGSWPSPVSFPQSQQKLTTPTDQPTNKPKSECTVCNRSLIEKKQDYTRQSDRQIRVIEVKVNCEN